VNPSPEHSAPHWSRRRFLLTGLLAAGGIGAAGAANWIAGLFAPSDRTAAAGSVAPSGAVSGAIAVASGSAGSSASAAPVPAARRRFVSRPDLSAPVMTISVALGGTDPGLIFFTPNNGTAPDSLLILDDAGEPIWIGADSRPAVANFQVARRHGLPTLAWWEGTVNGGLGVGEFVLANAAYRETARIRAGQGLRGDLHELQLTPDDTALILTGRQTAVPGSTDSTSPPPYQVWEGIIQEIEIATGAVRFEWRSLEHVDLAESLTPPPADGHSVFDYLHLNSIDVDADGSLLVSARNTSTIYKIDRTTGAVRWRLGGRRSDFTMGDRTTFGWQHDARRQPDGRLSLFDDQSPPTPSRGLFLRLDETTMDARFDAEYVHPRGLAAASQGNLEVLPSGNVFVGWGSTGDYSEFRSDGTLLYDVSFPGSKQSYRCFRSPWTGRPDDRPAMTVVGRSAGTILASMSWNGATEVASWAIHAGASTTALRLVRIVPRTGFETTITLDSAGPWYAVEAIDAENHVLGRSSTVTFAD
jgi:hypothetical protein